MTIPVVTGSVHGNYGIISENACVCMSVKSQLGSSPLLVNPPACYNGLGENRENFLTIGEEAIFAAHRDQTMRHGGRGDGGGQTEPVHTFAF